MTETKAKKFTFKLSEKSKGHFQWLYPQSLYIRLDGKQVGYVSPNNLITLTVYEADDKTSWKNITLKYQPKDFADAKRFLNENFTAIITKYNLRKSE